LDGKKHTVIKKVLCVFTAVITAALITMPDALAFDEKQNKNEQSQIQKQNEKKQNELKATEMTLNQKKEYSEKLQKKISDLSVKIQKSNDKIKELNKKIKKNQVLIEEKTAQIDDKLELLRHRLRAIYTAGDISSIEIILQAKNFSDYVDKMELVSSIAEADNKLIKNLQDKMQTITNEQKSLKEAKSKVEKEKKQLEADKKKLSELSGENQKIINDLLKQRTNKEAELEDNENRQRELEKALKNYEAQKAADAKKKTENQNKTSNAQSGETSVKPTETSTVNKSDTTETSTPKKTDDSSKTNNTNNTDNTNNNTDNNDNNNSQNSEPVTEPEEPATPQEPSGKYVWPCPGHTYLTSVFEEWRGTYNHGALDIADGNIYGATVVACYDGVVFSANDYCPHDYGKYESCGCGGGYGKYVMIDHGGGKISIYGHLSDVAVSTGQYVTAGQYIGNVGSTGYSTGPHLHFELRKDGVKYDPMSEY